MKMYSQIAPCKRHTRIKFNIVLLLFIYLFTLKIIIGNTIKLQHSSTVCSLQFLAVNQNPSIKGNFFSRTFMCSKWGRHCIRVLLYFKITVHALSYVYTSTFISRNNTIKLHIVNSDEPTSVHSITLKRVSLTEKGELRIKCVFNFSF